MSVPLRLSRGQAKAHTRGRLLAAAAEVFAEQGFAGASVDEIASRAGRTIGALYANFAGKDDLFRAVFDEHVPHLLDAAGGIPPQWVDAAPSFASFGAYLAELADQRTVSSTLETEFLRYALTRPELLGRLAERWRTSRTAVARLVAPYCAPHDATAVATVLLGLFEGLATQRRADPAAVPSELFAMALRWLTTGMERAIEEVAPAERTPENEVRGDRPFNGLPTENHPAGSRGT